MASVPLWTIGLTISTFVALPFLLSVSPWERNLNVAFLGNSAMYYNDFPRFMAALSNHRISQDSCLNGNATISNMWEGGNGMYHKFMTANALLELTIERSKYLYDFGACTTQQLLNGKDSRLYQQEELEDDEENPCLQDKNQLYYAIEHYRPIEWDFVVMNDHTRGPARYNTRQEALEVLAESYGPWFNKTGAIPVFLSTPAYWTDDRDMGGLVDIPTFTSLTYEGYRQYAQLLGTFLSKEHEPRIAPIGIAFLLVWEENYGMWEKLFHTDKIHASPHGTFLRGCILYYTLYGHMPPASVALQEDMGNLWLDSRRMQPDEDHAIPIPTRKEAIYLYNVAERIMIKGNRPSSFIEYKNGEAADYEEEGGNYGMEDRQ